jgi:hypothetical protein
MNNADVVIAHIKSLEAQLRVLKAEIESPSAPVESGHSFADLYGQLHGQVESTSDFGSRISDCAIRQAHFAFHIPVPVFILASRYKSKTCGWRKQL